MLKQCVLALCIFLEQILRDIASMVWHYVAKKVKLAFDKQSHPR